MAIGLTHYDYLPPVLAALPEGFATHSSRHHTLDHFKGREVAVVGAGASALDLAALLHQAGARAHVVARRAVIHFHSRAEETGTIISGRAPRSGHGDRARLEVVLVCQCSSCFSRNARKVSTREGSARSRAGSLLVRQRPDRWQGADNPWSYRSRKRKSRRGEWVFVSLTAQASIRR